MSKRIKGYTITLENDIREEDAEVTANAIKMIKGVISVTPVESNVNDQMNKILVKYEFINKLYKFIDELNNIK